MWFDEREAADDQVPQIAGGKPGAQVQELVPLLTTAAQEIGPGEQGHSARTVQFLQGIRPASGPHVTGHSPVFGSNRSCPWCSTRGRVAGTHLAL